MDQSYNLTRKHVAERRRRARINHYLQEIEHLVLPLEEQVSAIKLEKAEVLERTVAYLKEKRRTDGNETRAYAVGYVACLQSLQQLAKNISTQSDLHSMIATMLSNVQKRSTQTSTSINSDLPTTTTDIIKQCLYPRPSSHSDKLKERSPNRGNEDALRQNQLISFSSECNNLSTPSSEQKVKSVIKGDYSKENMLVDTDGAVDLETSILYDTYTKLGDRRTCLKNDQDEVSENMDCFTIRKRNEENSGQYLRNESELKTPFCDNNADASSVWRPWSCFEF